MKKTLAILLSIFLIFNINYLSIANDVEEETDYVWLYEEIENVSTTPKDIPNLNSRYICAFDRTSKKVLYAKNENTKVPMASTTKIMTAIVLMENLEDTGLELTSSVEVGKKASLIGGSRLGLKKGDKITVNDLMHGLMLCSRK